jgi:ACS family hexuronate transporter-like MFS transporter
MFPKRAIASVVGIGGMAGAAGGVLFPVLSGKILDYFTARGDVTHGYYILFAICAFAYVVTFAIHHLLAPRFEQFEMRKA